MPALEKYFGRITRINPTARLVSVNVGIIYKPRKEIGMTPADRAGEVYFAIALTDFNVANGLLILSEQAEDPLTLKAGEGMIWDGNSVGKPRDGEAGILLVIQYR